MAQKKTLGGILEVKDQVQLPETSTVPDTPASGFGALWIRDDSPNVLIFTDDDGTDHDLTETGGGGTVQGVDGTYDIQATNEGATTGNARGEYSVDLQTKRSAASQITSGTYAGILAGQDNTAQGSGAISLGGYQNNAAGENSFASGYQSVASGQNSNANGYKCNASGKSSIAMGTETKTGYSSRTFTVSGTTVTIAGVNVTSEFANSDTVTFFDLTGGTNNTLFSTTRTISSVAFSTDTTFTISSALDDRTGGKCASTNKGNGSVCLGKGTLQTTGIGSVAIGYSHSSSSMISSGTGSIILGHATSGGTMSSSNLGSIVLGFSTTSGSMTSTNFGSVSLGFVSGSGNVISASQRGSFAGGYANGDITSSFRGSFAFGRATTYGSLTSSGDGSIAMGNSSSSSYPIVSSQTGSVSIGRGNTANQDSATALGKYNTSSAVAAFSCGHLNTASAAYASVFGHRAIANKVGQRALAAGRFSANGDAQSSEYILRIQTTDATQTEMLINGAGRLTIANDSTWAFNIVVAARRTDANDESARYSFEGVIDRNSTAGSTALVGTVNKTEIEDTNAWDVTVDADTTNGSLRIQVTGEAAKTINWVAFVRTVETTG